MSSQKIPETDSIEELARFWETHDLTDFEDELEDVTEPVFERETVLKMHLQPEELEAVKKIARSKGIGFGDLIRQWVLERIRAS